MGSPGAFRVYERTIADVRRAQKQRQNKAAQPAQPTEKDPATEVKSLPDAILAMLEEKTTWSAGEAGREGDEYTGPICECSLVAAPAPFAPELTLSRGAPRCHPR